MAKVVWEMSKNSAYFANENRKAEQANTRIEEMHKRLAQEPSSESGALSSRGRCLTPCGVAALQRKVKAKIAAIEATRDLSHTYLHVDMDAFFAAVEERDNPALKGEPATPTASVKLAAGTAFAVGSESMISTASYAARAFGVRSAMPGFIAKKLCPQLVRCMHSTRPLMSRAGVCRF